MAPQALLKNEAIAHASAPPVIESIRTAKAAGLTYVSDHRPGITRIRARGGFRYLRPNGQALKDPATSARIRSLAIPPAWTDVWICSSPRGHLQAVGRDARGRKQYRYHPRYREVRDEAKYDRLIEFAKALPKIRATTRRHLRLKGLPREKVLAAVIQLLERTLIRVGNDEYARQNKSYGLTTLQDRHASVTATKARFEFRGKSGIEHAVEVDDPKLAKVIARCQDLPGEELFQYLGDDGKIHDIGSADVNAYLREIAGSDFTAKDFRTWAGTVLAAQALEEFASFNSQSEAKRQVVSAIERVAKRLGNTKAVCRKCYVHPAILNAHLDGTLRRILAGKAARIARNLRRLRPEEAAVLTLLQRRLANGSKR